MSRSDIPKSLRAMVLDRDRGRCRYCKLLQAGQAAVFHIDHIHPKSRGGATEITNLALQCPHCSLRKADKVIATDPASGRAATLFHPLQQNWNEHFIIDPDGTCHGLTDVGRATAAALGMNDPLPRLARQLQVRLGLIDLP